MGAFKLVYNFNDTGRYQGPFPSSITLYENKIRVIFDNGNVELVYKEGDNADGFQICCLNDQTNDCSPNSNNWVKGEISTSETASITIDFSCNGNSVPKLLRYSWTESPCPDEIKRCPIYSKENDLPVPPFLLEITKKETNLSLK